MQSRKNTLVVDSPGADSIEIQNTGLRPSWDVFWAVETEGMVGETTPSHRGTKSTLSVKSWRSGKHVQFVTGSSWMGEWDKLGMCGAGVYKMPHGVTYEGTMNGGLFEGIGILKYPNGGVLEGFWYGGKLKYCQYDYADGLKRENMLDWPYCRMPDRRFYSELLHGLRPADTEQLTHEDPPSHIPPGHYDVGDGFYNPRTKCVVDAVTGEILRIPTAVEEKWIIDNCRTGEVEPVGYHPELYENWLENVPQDESTQDDSDKEREILEVILQIGRELDPSTQSSRRETHSSLQFKVDTSSIREMRSVSSMAVSTEFESFLKKIIKELEENKKKLSLKTESDEAKCYKQLDDDSDDLVKLLGEITTHYSEKSKAMASDTKPILTSSSKMVKRSLPMMYSSLTYFPGASSTMLYKSISQQINATFAKKELQANPSQFMGSQVRYRVDYTDYDSNMWSKPSSDPNATKHSSKF